MKKTAVLAYAAGIMDGEGHITLLRRKRGCFSLIAQVSVTNTQEWLCRWLKMQFGGRVLSWTPKNNKWKRPYRWIIEQRPAIEYLNLILPYLNLKRPQAELAIDFQKRHRRGGHYNEEELSLFEADKTMMLKLNKRGLG